MFRSHTRSCSCTYLKATGAAAQPRSHPSTSQLLQHIPLAWPNPSFFCRTIWQAATGTFAVLHISLSSFVPAIPLLSLSSPTRLIYETCLHCKAPRLATSPAASSSTPRLQWPKRDGTDLIFRVVLGTGKPELAKCHLEPPQPGETLAPLTPV